MSTPPDSDHRAIDLMDILDESPDHQSKVLKLRQDQIRNRRIRGILVIVAIGLALFALSFYTLGQREGDRLVGIARADKDTQVAALYTRYAPTPTPIHSPTPTLTPSLTLTPSITPTPTLTDTPSLTLTPSNTLTPSLTNTPTETLTPSLTDTPTETYTPSLTLTRTRTPSETPTTDYDATGTAFARTSTRTALELLWTDTADAQTATREAILFNRTLTAEAKTATATFINSYKPIKLQELMNYAERHLGEDVVIRGRVFNIDGRALQMYAGGDYNNPVVVRSKEDLTIYRDDWVTVYGTVYGYFTGTNRLGATIKQPLLEDAVVVKGE